MQKKKLQMAFYNLSDLSANLTQEKIRRKMCLLFGHNWRYKDYSNHMKVNGDKYDFTISRNCTRCKQHSYFYDKWENEAKSIHDHESDFHSSDKIPVENGVYAEM